MKTKTKVDIFDLLGVPTKPLNVNLPGEENLEQLAKQHVKQLQTYEKLRDDFTRQIDELTHKRETAIKLVEMTNTLIDLFDLEGPDKKNKASMYCRRGHRIVEVFCKQNPDNPGAVHMSNQELCAALGRKHNYISTWIIELDRANAESPILKCYGTDYRPGYKLSACGLEMAHQILAKNDLSSENRVRVKCSPKYSRKKDGRYSLVHSKTHEILNLFRLKNPSNPEKARIYGPEIVEGVGAKNESALSVWMYTNKIAGTEYLTQDKKYPPKSVAFSRRRPYMLTEAGLKLLVELEKSVKNANE